MGLTSYDIVWHNMGILKEFITSCGEFPNVSLMGTKGCINYNPILARRQFGFVMTNGPTEREVRETVYFGKGGDASMFERVKVSWKHIHQNGKQSFDRSGGTTLDAYSRWIQDRVKVLLLPYKRNYTRNLCMIR